MLLGPNLQSLLITGAPVPSALQGSLALSGCSSDPFSLPHIFPHSAQAWATQVCLGPQAAQDNTDSTPLEALPILANATLTCNSLQAPDLTDTRPSSHVADYLPFGYGVLLLDDLIKVSFFPKTLTLTFLPHLLIAVSHYKYNSPHRGRRKGLERCTLWIAGDVTSFFTSSKAGIAGSWPLRDDQKGSNWVLSHAS